jgi:Ran GTPase-activating protein (RanGAP) involved in mRNA processing and transport
LAWNGFGNEGADMMGNALTHNVQLEELDMRSNRIGNAGVANLCLGLKDNTTLKKLIV